MSEQTPMAIESARNQAFGQALLDVAEAADELEHDLGSSSWTAIVRLSGLCAALGRLKALGWRPGSKKKDG